MDESIKPIVPLVALAIVAFILFAACTPLGNMVVSGIQEVVMDLFQEAGITISTPAA